MDIERVGIWGHSGERLGKFGFVATEKYPHVTFFFNGGKESPFKDEIRIMCPSP